MRAVVILGFLLLLITDQAEARPLRIMPAGDSITDGGSDAGAWRTRFYELMTGAGIPFQFVGSLSSGGPELLQSGQSANEGHCGWGTLLLEGILPQSVAAYRPDRVLLMIGTNDLWWRRDGVNDQPNQGSPDDVKTPPNVGAALSRLYSMVAQVQREGSPVILASIPPVNRRPPWDPSQPNWNGYVDAYNAGVREIAAALSAEFVDMHALFVDTNGSVIPSKLHDDGVHPVPATYDEMARVWYEAVRVSY